MSELDEKLNSILSNPAMMQQIMSLAQALNQSEAQRQSTNSTAPPQQSAEPAVKEAPFNPNLLNKIAGLMERGSIDKNQESLLKALGPYLSRQKLQKLERAMHAAKMAGIASEMVNVRGQSPFSRR
ncbi:MAG: hypothetical protein SO355_02240 [Candidatus Faecousia sp.]|nr:hypothetical protein [Candidatus Faecousia sp.]